MGEIVGSGPRLTGVACYTESGDGARYDEGHGRECGRFVEFLQGRGGDFFLAIASRGMIASRILWGKKRRRGGQWLKRRRERTRTGSSWRGCSGPWIGLRRRGTIRRRWCGVEACAPCCET